MATAAAGLDDEVIAAPILACVHVVDGPVPVVSHDRPARRVAEVGVAVGEDIGAANPVADPFPDPLVVPPRVQQDVSAAA